MAYDYYKIKGATKADIDVLLADNYIRQRKMLLRDYTETAFGETTITVSPTELLEFLNNECWNKYTLGDVVESLVRLSDAKLYYKEGKATGEANLFPQTEYTVSRRDEEGRRIEEIKYFGGVPTPRDVVHRFATVFDRFEYETT